MFYARRPYKRTVVCSCGQPIGDARAAAGARRCSACVERFERSTPARQKTQPQLFEDARPSRGPGNGAGVGGKHATAAPPSKSVPSKPAAPHPPAAPPVPRPDPVAATNARAAELRAANQRAAADRRMQRYTTLRAAGVPRERAMAIVDAEEGTEP